MTYNHETYVGKYTMLDPPPDDRCNALKFNCANPACDYRWPDITSGNEDRTTDTCPECGFGRGLCGQYRITGRTRCKYHGGHAARGLAHTNYKGRGYSKNMPTQWLEHYQRAANSDQTDLLDLTNTLALLEARKQDLLLRAKQHAPAPAMWDTAKKHLFKYKKASSKYTRSRPNTTASQNAAEDMQQSFADLEKTLMLGYMNDLQLEKSLDNLDTQYNKLLNTELKRRKMIAEMVTEDQVMTLVGDIMGIINNYIEDGRLKGLIVEKITTRIERGLK